MKEELEKLKDLTLLDIRRIRTYRISTILSLLFLLGALITTFIYVVIPMHSTILTWSFILGIIAGIYTILGEIILPEKHLHMTFKLPDNYDGWKVLYLVSKCIKYDLNENIIIIQFASDIEGNVDKFIKELVKKGEIE